MTAHMFRLSLILLFLAAGCAAAALPARAGGHAEISVAPDHLVVRPLVAHQGLRITLQGADGRQVVHRTQSSGALTVPLASASGEPLPDGLVAWEVVLTPRLDDGPVERSRAVASVPVRRRVESGSLRIVDGLALTRLSEEGAISDTVERAETAADATSGFLVEEDVITGDLSVRNSLCVGDDCADSESFGFDTLRFRESNLRIHFDDTSTIAGFPANDWRLEANSTASGGGSYFSLVDVTAGETPFQVVAGAPQNALVVDAQGNLGLGTSTPGKEVHIMSGNSPSVRFEQDLSQSYPEQIWELSANESGFLLRDPTHGKIPFVIETGARTTSLYVDSDGAVGMGTGVPEANLHIVADSAANLNGLRIENLDTGNIQTQFAMTGSGAWEWRQTFRSGDMIFDSQEDGANELVLTTGGQLTVVSLVETSDRAMKENFRTIDRQSVLAQIVDLPISRWNYIEQGAGVEHIGPMAQDFHGAFGIGPDDKHIATRDAASVALVGVQALYDLLQEERRELEAERRLLREEMDARWRQLEARCGD